MSAVCVKDAIHAYEAFRADNRTTDAPLRISPLRKLSKILLGGFFSQCFIVQLLIFVLSIGLEKSFKPYDIAPNAGIQAWIHTNLYRYMHSTFKASEEDDKLHHMRYVEAMYYLSNSI